MTSTLLREAAQTLREKAEAATPGRWTVREEHGRDFTDEGWSYIAVQSPDDDEVAATAYPGDSDTGDAQADAAFIALADPTVALAVADLLDAEDTHQFGPTEQALAVARAVLRRES